MGQNHIGDNMTLDLFGDKMNWQMASPRQTSGALPGNGRPLSINKLAENIRL
jgi:hypothetical protein